MSRGRIVAILVMLCVVDMFIPVPILGLTLLHVIFTKPTWFTRAVQTVYDV